jgi:hypothetical protein
MKIEDIQVDVKTTEQLLDDFPPKAIFELICEYECIFNEVLYSSRHYYRRIGSYHAFLKKAAQVYYEPKRETQKTIFTEKLRRNLQLLFDDLTLTILSRNKHDF